jgi:hypothetical protein
MGFYGKKRSLETLKWRLNLFMRTQKKPFKASSFPLSQQCYTYRDWPRVEMIFRRRKEMRKKQNPFRHDQPCNYTTVLRIKDFFDFFVKVELNWFLTVRSDRGRFRFEEFHDYTGRKEEKILLISFHYTKDLKSK